MLAACFPVISHIFQWSCSGNISVSVTSSVPSHRQSPQSPPLNFHRVFQWTNCPAVKQSVSSKLPPRRPNLDGTPAAKQATRLVPGRAETPLLRSLSPPSLAPPHSTSLTGLVFSGLCIRKLHNRGPEMRLPGLLGGLMGTLS